MEINKVYQIIRSTLDLPNDYIFESDIRPSFVPGWDSLGWIKIVVQIEIEINSELPLDLFNELGTVKEFCETVVKFVSVKPEVK